MPENNEGKEVTIENILDVLEGKVRLTKEAIGKRGGGLVDCGKIQVLDAIDEAITSLWTDIEYEGKITDVPCALDV